MFSYLLYHSILSESGGSHYYPYFKSEETEAGRSDLSFGESHK